MRLSVNFFTLVPIGPPDAFYAIDYAESHTEPVSAGAGSESGVFFTIGSGDSHDG